MPPRTGRSRTKAGPRRPGAGVSKRAASTTHHHHILRVDNEKTATHCWKIKIRRRGKVTYKYFTDGRYGGKAKALAAAKLFRRVWG